jgi:hypothetical protein
MITNFIISQSCTSFTNRPPISYKVREYLGNYINTNFIEPKKFLLDIGWKIDILIIFINNTSQVKLNEIKLGRVPIVAKEEKIKIYEILIPLKLIDESDNKYLKTIQLMQEALGLFFNKKARKGEKKYITDLWQKVDYEYLLTLTYPAPLTEQKYISDKINSNGDVESVINWTKEESR